MRTLLLTLTIVLIALPAYAKYSGGTGEPNDPYRIATAEDLIALGEDPNDYGKHFILTADIDLDPNLPGRKVFERAVIASDIDPNDKYSSHQGTTFTGVFDGDGHSIFHLTIQGNGYLGLFGILAGQAEARNLGLVDVNILNSGSYAGGLVGYNGYGRIVKCFSSGSISGTSDIGGLVGMNYGTIISSYSSAAANATGYYIGGLVGRSDGSITTSYSTGAVNGKGHVGGLVGWNYGKIRKCYSAGAVNGDGDYIGGMVGFSESFWENFITSCCWDIETSGRLGSVVGVGLTTSEMMDSYMLGLNGFANDPNWVLDAGRDYPRLAWEGTPGQMIPEPIVDWLEGEGTPEAPYHIDTADQLILLSRTSILWKKDFILRADIDLDPALPGRRTFKQSLFQTFTGIFDGNDHTISHLTITGGSYLGLFGRLESGAKIRDLGLTNVKINGKGYIGGLVGNNVRGSITACYCSGAVSGTAWYVGGLVGSNRDGRIFTSHNACTISGDDFVGGLVGSNTNDGNISTSYSSGTVSGDRDVGGLSGYNSGRIAVSYNTGSVNGTGWGVGGLVGNNYGQITATYSTGSVGGYSDVGGLVGHHGGIIAMSYSAGLVRGSGNIGGLVGYGGWAENVVSSFWDIQTSGQAASAGGTGLTTHQMQDRSTYLEVGWDLTGEVSNGTSDYWQTSQGDYPKLHYPVMPEGKGISEQPYLIRDARDLGTVWFAPMAHYRVESNIDLSGITWSMAVVPWFAGTFNGNGHLISNLNIQGTEYLGLFGQLESEAKVSKLGLEAANVNGTRDIGSLAGYSDGSITASYSTGTVSGTGSFAFLGGGLVGYNTGSLMHCYSTSAVSSLSEYATIGGLVGCSYGTLTHCYSTGAVNGNGSGGLVGYGAGTACVWDMNTSGLSASGGGVGLTTAEMMDPYMLGLNGFAMDPNWALNPGRDYPRLAWESTMGDIIPEPNIDWLEGMGTTEEPYHIEAASQLILLGKAGILCDKHFILDKDIDLNPNRADVGILRHGVIQTFAGTFDGNGHTISNMSIIGSYYIGLFGHLVSGAEVRNLALVNVNVSGSGSCIGGLAGTNLGRVTGCYTTGVVNGNDAVGGLVGNNGVSSWLDSGYIANCYSTAEVGGVYCIGGLVGNNGSSIFASACIWNSYSTGAVSGTGENIGGLVGANYLQNFGGIVTHCFWDIQTSGQATSDGGIGKTTAEMQTAATFLDVGWDFVGETANGTDDIWWILEGQDYPRLWWEATNN